MNIETSSFFPPQPSFEESLEIWAWERFHQSILDKGPALNYLISFLTEIINSKEQKLFDSYSDKYGDYITKYQLHTHYFKLLCQQEDKSDKNIWNTQNNLLRVLKRMKSDEPLYLLPEEDRGLTYKFIDRLNHPPRDGDY